MPDIDPSATFSWHSSPNYASVQKEIHTANSKIILTPLAFLLGLILCASSLDFHFSSLFSRDLLRIK